MKDFKKRTPRVLQNLGSSGRTPYNNDSRPGGFSRGGGRSRFGAERSTFGPPKELFQATCNQCHKACEVPFRPNGKKPVYCRDCFVKEDAGSAPSRDFRSRDDSRPRTTFRTDTPAPYDGKSISELSRQIEALSVKLDALIQIVGVSKEAMPALPRKVARRPVVSKRN